MSIESRIAAAKELIRKREEIDQQLAELFGGQTPRKPKFSIRGSAEYTARSCPSNCPSCATRLVDKKSIYYTNMRIITWNINGIRAALSDNFNQWLVAAEPDILCLQETRIPLSVAETLAFHGYQAHWHSSGRRGYSGVAILAKSSMAPTHVEVGIGIPSIDVEARIITAKFPDFTLINVYAPHSHRELTRLSYKIFFFESLIDLLHTKYAQAAPVILTGDFNVAHTDLDLTNYRQNKRNAGCLPDERNYLDMLCTMGYLDAFRELCPDPGHYTWWSQRKGVREKNIGWRLDYFFVNELLRPQLRGCFHSPEVRGSDHCPVTVELALGR